MKKDTSALRGMNFDPTCYDKDIYDKLKLLALDTFTWTGLPAGMESEHIEEALYGVGGAFFFNDNRKGTLCLPAVPGGRLNVYREPLNLIVTGYNYSKTINKAKGVYIKNNKIKKPTRIFIQKYAALMTTTESVIRANLNQQKFPYVVGTNEDNELTVKSIFKKVEEGCPIIYAGEGFDFESLRVIETNAPYLLDRLLDFKYETEREILTFLGLNNSYEKKERLVVDEVNSNNEYIYRNVAHQYEERIKARDAIREMFDLPNLEVTLNRQAPTNGSKVILPGGD